MSSSGSVRLRYKTISYPHERCESSSDDTCSILMTALKLVKETLCSAQEYIGADIPETFYYKFPRKVETPPSVCSADIIGGTPYSYSSASFFRSQSSTTNDGVEDIDPRSTRLVILAPIIPTYGPGVSGGGVDDGQSEFARHPDDIQWPTIRNFNLQNCAIKIRDYIDLWKLTPNTKYSILMRGESKQLKNKGTRYFVDAMFSSPTPKCPNPLAVARVHFYIQVPELMPRFYPVMITYRFEGFKSVYHAVGHKQLRSLEFQRYFIDTILHTKLKFYAELFQCRYSMDLCPPHMSNSQTSEAAEEESPRKCSHARKLSIDDEYSSSEAI